MTQEKEFELIQNHFDYISQLVARGRKDGLKRGPLVMGLPQLERDLYFVHDVLAITNNAGIGAWIHYHIEDEGWIEDAARAYKAIGNDEAARDLLAAKDKYRNNSDDDEWDRPFEECIIGKECDHLAANGDLGQGPGMKK